MLHKTDPLVNISCITRKSVFGISEQVQHKSDCTTTEVDTEELEISELGSRGIVLSVYQKQRP